jgi:WD40 repeat protein
VSSSFSVSLLDGSDRHAPWRLSFPSGPTPRQRVDGESANPTVMCWHKDGGHLAVGDQSGGLSLWRLEAGSLVPILRWSGHKNTVKALCWLGDRLASGSRDGSIGLWDGEVLAGKLTGHRGTVTGLCPSPDGETLVSVSDDGTLILWDVATMQPKHQWGGHQGWVTCVAIHPTGDFMLTGSRDATLRCWQMDNGDSSPWYGHVATITAVVFSPDGLQAASSSEDGALKIWEVSSGALVCRLHGHEACIHDLDWTGPSLVSAGADFRLGVWRGSRGVGWLQGHRRPVLSVAVTADGESVVSGGADRSLAMWDLASAHPMAIHHAGSVRSLAFSSTGDWVASGSRDETVWIRDAASGERLSRLTGHTGAVQGVAFSPGSEPKLLSISTDGTARVWEVTSGRETAVIAAHDSPISVCAWSVDGRVFFTGARDGLIRVWDGEAYCQLLEIRAHAHWVRSLAVHPDGVRLLVGSYDGTVSVWNWRDRTRLSQFDGHQREDGSMAPVTGVAVMPDGKTGLSGGLDNRLRTFCMQTGESLSVVEAHTGGLVGLLVHRGRVFSAGMDRALRQWTVVDGALRLDHSLVFPVELDSLAAHGDRLWVGDRAGQTWFLEVKHPGDV